MLNYQSGPIIFLGFKYLLKYADTLTIIYQVIGNGNHRSSSLIDIILWQRFFSNFAYLFQSTLSEGNDVTYGIKIAYHVENSLPNMSMMVIWG